MADTQTRQQVVEANIEATVAKYGEDSYELRKIQLLEDISVSLAMLVDNSGS